MSPSELSAVIEREGAQAAIQGTGRSAEELINIVGKESSAGRRLVALAGGIKSATVTELTHVLPQLAQKSAAEAVGIVHQSIDVLGPALTLERAGGWEVVARVVADEAGVVARLQSWRKGAVRQRRPTTDRRKWC